MVSGQLSNWKAADAIAAHAPSRAVFLSAVAPTIRCPSRAQPEGAICWPSVPALSCLAWLAWPPTGSHPSPQPRPPSPSCRRVTTYDVQTAMSTSPDCACRAVFSLFSHRRRFDAFDWMARRVSLRSGLGVMSVCLPGP